MDTHSSKHKSTRLTGLLAFLIPFILCIAGLRLGGFRPFGDKDLFTSVGQEETAVRYFELYDRMHGESTGSFFLNTTAGLGEDYSGTIGFYLSDPTNLIVLLFPRSMMLTMLHLLFALKLGLAGLFAYLYLCHRRKRLAADSAAMDIIRKDAIEKLSIKAEARKQKKIEKLTAAGKAYKEDIVIGGKAAPEGLLGKLLSAPGLTELSFAMIYALSQYLLGTGTNITYISAFMLLPLIIMGLERLIEDGRWGMFAITYSLSFFASFHGALMITVFLVFFFALYSFRSLPNFLRSLKLFLLSAVLAVGTAAMVIIPAFGSSAADTTLSTKFAEAYFSTGIYDNLKAFLAGTTPSASLMYGHNLDLYCGIFTLFLILLFALNPHIRPAARVKDCILLVLLWSGTWLFTTNHIFNGFFYFDHFSIAFGFLLTFFAMRTAYTAFYHIGHSRPWHLHISGAVLTGASILSMLLCGRYDSITPLTLSLWLILFYYILTLLYRSRSMAGYLYKTLACLLLLGELAILFPQNMKALTKYSLSIEKTRAYSDYETARYLHKERPGARVEIYDSSCSYATPVTEALLGYDYVIARRGTPVNSGLKELGNITYSTLYQNPGSTGAHFTTARLDQYRYNRMYPFISSNILSETYLGGKPVFIETSGSAFPYASENECLYYVVPNEDGDLYALLNYVSHLSGEATAFEQIETIQKYPDITYTNEYMQIYKFDQAAFGEMLQRFTPVTFPKFSGSLTTYVTTPEAGYLVIPVPRLAGLTIKVSGKEVKAESFMDEASMIPVPGGEFKIEIKYHPVLFITGCVISAVFLLALVLLLTLKVFGKVEEKETKVSGFLRANWVYIAAFSIPFFGMLFMAAFTGCYPFGMKFLLPGDTFVQSYPGAVNISEKLKNGTFFSFLAYDNGLVYDRSSIILSYLPESWKLLKFRLLPSSLYRLDFSLNYILNFSYSALSIVFYLTHRKNRVKMHKTDSRLLLFSMAYVFSAASIAFFGYHGFGFFLYFPLILLGLESLVYENKVKLYILVLSFEMLGDAYYAFIMCEFIVLFFLIQDFRSIKHFFRSVLRLALSSILAAGLAAMWMLPYYLRTTNSTYVEKDSVAPALTGWFTSLRTVFGQFRMTTTVTTASALSYKANLYCGMAILLLLPLYALNKSIKLHVRIRHLTLLLILFLAFDNKLLNFVFHGFHMQSLSPNRFVFAFILLLLIMAYETLLHFSEFRPRTIFLSIFGASVFYLIFAKPDSRSDGFYRLTLIFVGLQVLLALFYVLRRNKKVYQRLFAVLLTAEILIAAVPQIATSIGHPSSALTHAADIDRLVDNHPEMSKDLVLTEDIDTPIYNIGQMTDIQTISTFNSWLTNDHMMLLRKWNISCSLNCVYYLSGSPLSDMLFRVNYHTVNLFDEGSESVYPVIDQVNNVVLHQNPYALPLGIFIQPSQELEKWDAQDNYNDNIGALHQNEFLRIIGGRDIYNELPLVDTPSDNSNKENYMRMNAETYQGSLDNTLKLFRFYISEDVDGPIYLSVYNYILYIGTSEKGVHDTLELYLPLPEDSGDQMPDVHLYTIDEEALQEAHDLLAAHTMTDTHLDGSTIKGKIDAPEDGMIFLSLPNLPGYHAYVDGSEVDISTFLGGVGIPVTKGSHSIKLSYTPTGLMPGIIITGISFLILIGWFVTARIMRKKKKAAGEPAAQDTDSAAEA